MLLHDHLGYSLYASWTSPVVEPRYQRRACWSFFKKPALMSSGIRVLICKMFWFISEVQKNWTFLMVGEMPSPASSKLSGVTCWGQPLEPLAVTKGHGSPAMSTESCCVGWMGYPFGVVKPWCSLPSITKWCMVSIFVTKTGILLSNQSYDLLARKQRDNDFRFDLVCWWRWLAMGANNHYYIILVEWVATNHQKQHQVDVW